MTETVIQWMTDNLAFRKPAVDLVTLRAGLDDFKEAIAAQPNRGKAGTAVKYQKRARLQFLWRSRLTIFRRIVTTISRRCCRADSPQRIRIGVRFRFRRQPS